MVKVTVWIPLMKQVALPHLVQSHLLPLHGLAQQAARLMNTNATMASAFICGMYVMALTIVVTTQMNCIVQRQVPQT